MKKFLKYSLPLIFISLLLFLTACGTTRNIIENKVPDTPSPAAEQPVSSEENNAAEGEIAATENASQTVTFTDALNRPVELQKNPERVIALLGSFAEAYELSGGVLTGVTSDALEESRISNSPDAEILGTNKEPNMELLLSLEPDLVLLSADIVQHQEMGEQLDAAEIPYVYLKIEEFEEYLSVLKFLTELTGREDLYEQNGAAVQKEIEETRSRIAEAGKEKPEVLLIRAMSTGAKGKAGDIMPGKMLSELGAEHLVDRYPSLLDELSIEIILKDDPEYIFVVTMGDSDKAISALNQQMADNPAWSELSAVKNGKCFVLPKELFHFKPNARWGEAYLWLSEILYPGFAPELRPDIEESVLNVQ